MKLPSRWAALVFLCVVLWPALAVAQQDYPSKSIRLIVPFPPGGSTSVVARLAGQKLGESLGQQIVIDARPGGNTVIGTEAAAKAPPDGYTMLLVSSPFVIMSHLYDKLPFDVMKDFVPISTLSVIMKIPALPDIRETLLAQIMDPLITTPDQFTDLIKSDMARYAKVIKTANFKIDN